MKYVLSEEEKKEIRVLHSKIIGSLNTDNHKNNLFEEKNKLRKLMNLPLLLESVDPTELLSKIGIPGLKNLAESLPYGVRQFADEVATYSKTLRDIGITKLDDLSKIADEWQASQKGLTKTYSPGSSDVVASWLKQSEKGIIITKEITEGLIKKQTQTAAITTAEKLRKINYWTEELPSGTRPDSPLDDVEFGGDVTEEMLSTSISKLNDVKAKVDDAKIKLDTKIEQQKVKLNNTKLDDATRKIEETTYKNLTDYKTSLNELSTSLDRQIKIFNNAIEAQKATVTTGITKLKWGQVEYDELGLNFTQKILLRMNVDSVAPLIYKVVNLSVRMVKQISLEQQLVETTAMLTKLSNDMLNKNLDSLKQEYALTIRHMKNLIEMQVGRQSKLLAMDKAKVINLLNAAGGGDDVQTIWRDIGAILKQQVDNGYLTKEQSNQMLSDILNVHLVVESSESAKNWQQGLDFFKGLLSFKTDLNSLAESKGIKLDVDIDNTFKNAWESSEYLKTPVERWWNQSVDSWFKSFWGGNKVLGAWARYMLFGLPKNIGDYFRPLSRYGYNLRGAVMTYLNLLFVKFTAGFIFACIGTLWGYMWEYKFGFGIGQGRTRDDAQHEATKSWVSYVESIGTGKIFSSLITIDWGSTEMDINKVSKQEFVDEVSYKLGPIELVGAEAVVEAIAFYKTAPTDQENNSYLNELAQENAKNTQDKINRMAEEKQKLYYTQTKEKQFEVSNIENFALNLNNTNIIQSVFPTLDKESLELIITRLFPKTNYVGLDLVSTTPTKEEIEQYLNVENYAGYRCVCLKKLKYRQEEVTVYGSEKKIATIPDCNDYVVVLDYLETSFIDGDKLNSENNTDNYKKYYGKIGFVFDEDAKNLSNISYKDWLPFSEIKKYLR